MNLPFFNRRWFLFCLLGLALFKLWLVHTEEIMGSATEYDALWFVNSAKHWYWKTPFSWTAFVRPPAYPLFIAFVHFLHIPLRLAIELLQLFCALALVLALKQADISRIVCVFSFAALILHPYAFQAYDYTMADWFYAAMLTLLLAGFILMIFGSAQIPVSILSGITLAILWNTREESLLLLTLCLAFLAFWFFREQARLKNWSAGFKQLRRPIMIMAATAAVLIFAVYSVNWRTFGAFAKSDMTSPAFNSAFHALLRIKSDQARRFVPIPNDALQKAFAVSPTFATLKEQLDGGIGKFWRVETARWEETNHEIGVNWLIWALRQAADRAGVYADPAKANDFFHKVAHEINRACDEGRIESRFVLGNFVDPLTAKGWDALPQSFGRMARLFVQGYEIRPLRDDEILRPEQRMLYDEVTLRGPFRAETDTTMSILAEKWIARNHRFLVFALLAGGVAAMAALFFRFRLIDWSEPVYTCIALIGFAVLLRVTLFSVIDATSWSFPFDRFLFPVMPLLSVTLILLIYTAFRGGRSLKTENELSTMFPRP